MTIHDLYAFQNVKTTMRILEDRLTVLNRYGDANAGTRTVLMDAWRELDALAAVEKAKLRAIAESVDDPVIREIITKRFLDGEQWIDIAVEVVPLDKDATRTAPLKRVERYIKNL